MTGWLNVDGTPDGRGLVDGQAWLAARAEDAAAGRFFGWMPMFTAVARRPRPAEA
jgi:hypothetical protein